MYLAISIIAAFAAAAIVYLLVKIQKEKDLPNETDVNTEIEKNLTIDITPVEQPTVIESPAETVVTVKKRVRKSKE